MNTDTKTFAAEDPALITGVDPPAGGDSRGRMLSNEGVARFDFSNEPPLEPTPELLAELSADNARLESASPFQIIEYAVEKFYPKITMATAFGPEGCVILHFLSQIKPDVYVFNLETGYQFAEMHDLRDRIAERYGIVVDYRSHPLSVADYEKQHGGPLYGKDPTRCCFDRKITVLREAIQGFHSWMSGIRRDQSEHRSVAPIVGWDKKFNLVKVSPLANWTKKDVWTLIMKEHVPYNSLHDQGFPSIGCWPCTRAVGEGELDERAGRWSGTAKTECGLHTMEEQAGGSGI